MDILMFLVLLLLFLAIAKALPDALPKTVYFWLDADGPQVVYDEVEALP
jgi:hypothetical protein